jgi:hypothetical protein
MKKFNITFTEKKKYFPATRTIMVEADSDYAALMITAQEHDSLKLDNGFLKPTWNKITIDKIEEIKVQ